ncbi:MAG TPA: hydrolase, partial [Candidatus Omnitrophica bacterium]|nr:hydrolase [Candidatus Omnitrophota bacterium]
MGVSRLRIACVQINAGEDWKKNWKQSEKFLIQSARQGSCIAALPENFM